jgi:hypothetical protein
MIELEVQLVLRHAASAADYSAGQIHRAHLGFDNLHVTKDSPEGINDVPRIKIAGCDLVQHWRKQNEILATDQRNVYILATREAFIKVHRGVQPGKAATCDHDPRLFHLPNTFNFFSEWGSLSEPETDQQNQDKRGQNEPRNHNDLDSQFANGWNVVIDVRIAVKESVAVAKNIRAA